jgi:hypothetical protein
MDVSIILWQNWLKSSIAGLRKDACQENSRV